jgi:hypothetical protein
MNTAYFFFIMPEPVVLLCGLVTQLALLALFLQADRLANLQFNVPDLVRAQYFLVPMTRADLLIEFEFMPLVLPIDEVPAALAMDMPATSATTAVRVVSAFIGNLLGSMHLAASSGAAPLTTGNHRHEFRELATFGKYPNVTKVRHAAYAVTVTANCRKTPVCLLCRRDAGALNFES